MHSNVTSENVSGFTLAGPPCILWEGNCILYRNNSSNNNHFMAPVSTTTWASWYQNTLTRQFGIFQWSLVGLLISPTLGSHCMNSSWLAAATQMTAREPNPTTGFYAFPPQPPSLPGLGTSQQYAGLLWGFEVFYFRIKEQKNYPYLTPGLGNFSTKNILKLLPRLTCREYQ